MKYKKSPIKKLIAQLEAIKSQARELETRYAYELSLVHPKYKNSARNLLHYLALRHAQIDKVQLQLGELGISRLAKAESHVMASLNAVIAILRTLIKDKKISEETRSFSIDEGRKRIKDNTVGLLGKKLKGSSVRIMVTMPSEAARDKKLIKNIIKAGMNSARINCAHDDPDTWKKIIDQIHKNRKKTGRNCKICMDLGGPKLRTGLMSEGPKVLHVQPERDLVGKVIAPAEVVLTSKTPPFPESPHPYIPVEKAWLRSVRKNDKIIFKDARNKNCKLIVTERTPLGVHAECFDSAYIISGTIMHIDKETKTKNQKTVVGDLPSAEQRIILKSGDTLFLHKDPRPGESTLYDKTGTLLQPAHISCTLPEIFQDVRAGEPVILDDGKIEGRIIQIGSDEIEIEVTYAKEGGSKLAGDKGINLPESNLRLKGLTDKDREDLRFITKHAEIVNMSFVNDPADVLDLLEELHKLNGQHLGIILKIETQKGYKNLPGILLAAMRSYPIGVMIARGDLAIEGGWVNLAQYQEEIMWLCEAAHIPIIWATQVLETLAKKGRPSRAEISDAALAQRAECVMLNKGPYIVETIEILDKIMKSMQNYQQKKSPILPVITGDNFLNMKA